MSEAADSLRGVDIVVGGEVDAKMLGDVGRERIQ